MFITKLQYKWHIHVSIEAVDIEADIGHAGHFTKSIENLRWTPKRGKCWRWIEAYQEPKEEKKEEAWEVTPALEAETRNGEE